MKSLAFLVALAACGAPQTAPAGDGSGTALYAKKVLVEWAMHASDDGKRTDVFLQTNDDQGQQVSYPVGSYEGECRQFHPAPEMGAVSGVACSVGPNIVELHAVIRDEDVIVLRMRSDPAHPPDPMAREEVTRVKIPRGTGIHH
ncbi:MAG TPA: hypothetical protein VG871_22635 [Vicinamibacterales bacterium]|nr:hypothetical protein [Vicinamibacterales bacterium]